MGTHLRVLSESYPMNTNMTGFGCFYKIFASLGEFSRSIEWDNIPRDITEIDVHTSSEIIKNGLSLSQNLVNAKLGNSMMPL